MQLGSCMDFILLDEASWGEDSYLLPLCRLLLLRSQPAAACCLNKPHITIDSPSITIALLWNLKLSSHWCIRGKAECHATVLHRTNAVLYSQLIAHLDRVLNQNSTFNRGT